MHYVNVLWSLLRKLLREVLIHRVLLLAVTVSLRQSTLDCLIGKWLVLGVNSNVIILNIFDAKVNISSCVQVGRQD